MAIGVFLFGKSSKTTYVKNNFLQPFKDIEFGNLQDTIIPSILKAPQNLTEDLASVLAQEIISKNSEFKVGDLLPGPGMNVPNPSEIVNRYISDGLKTANENIFKALVGVENDPLATITAIKQFEVIMENWQDLQKKFDVFIQKVNKK